jgi:hypothetical protein
MRKRAKADEPVDTTPEPAWLRNRRLRQVELDAANAHGAELASRYGYGPPRQQFAVLGYGRSKLRRRR